MEASVAKTEGQQEAGRRQSGEKQCLSETEEVSDKSSDTESRGAGGARKGTL